MVKSARSLARSLGKLGIECMISDNDAIYANAPHGWPKRPYNVPRYDYGFKLKETKDWVERYLDRKAGTLISDTII